MSPARPKGIWSMAEASRNAVTIQPSATAFSDNSSDIRGNARLMDDPVKGTSDADKHTTAKME